MVKRLLQSTTTGSEVDSQVPQPLYTMVKRLLQSTTTGSEVDSQVPQPLTRLLQSNSKTASALHQCYNRTTGSRVVDSYGMLHGGSYESWGVFTWYIYMQRS